MLGITDASLLSPISQGFISAVDATLARLMYHICSGAVICAKSSYPIGAAFCCLLQVLLLPQISNWHPATPVGGVGPHAESIWKPNPCRRPSEEIVARSPLFRATHTLGEFIRRAQTQTIFLADFHSPRIQRVLPTDLTGTRCVVLPPAPVAACHAIFRTAPYSCSVFIWSQDLRPGVEVFVWPIFRHHRGRTAVHHQDMMKTWVRPLEAKVP